jgi:hypothetical protein
VIRADINEEFPVSVSLVDETKGIVVSNETVLYDVRDTNDNALTPPLTGTMLESTVEPGIYVTELSIDTPGEYVLYATCSGFLPNTEEIVINEENIYDLVKQNRHYNISVEDVARSNSIPTASQAVRHVPLGKTDYIITRIKYDNMPDWAGSTVSGTTYAWYKTIDDDVPYKIGGPF